MKNLFISALAILLMICTTQLVHAQTDAQSIIASSDNQGSLLSRIYASEVTITSAPNDHHVTGTFLIRNSEKASVGNIQYETMLLSPLPQTPTNQLVSDAPDVYDRIRSSDILTLKAGEKRTISFSYNAPNVPQASYRIRIQIITTNDRKLGWGDTTLALGGASSFIVVNPTHVIAKSSDPITKESGSTWEPLYGVNIDSHTPIQFEAVLKNIGKEELSGTIMTSTKRLLYANQKEDVVTKQTISISAKTSKTVIIPMTTKTKPGAYITFLTLVDKNHNRISGVGEYRYVVRGESASVVSVQIESIPSIEKDLAHVSFVIGGSADRATPVKGTLHITINDSTGNAGSATQDFSATGASPITGTAQVTMQRILCGTPTVTISLTDSKGELLDSFSVEAPAFANPSCKTSILSFVTKPIMNIALAILAIGITGMLVRMRIKNK